MGLILLFSFFMLCSYSHAESQAPSEVEVTSDTIECYNKEKRCIAKGHARAENSAGSQKTTLFADELLAFMGADQKLSTLQALGHVEVLGPDFYAQAERGEYRIQEDVVYLEGNVKITHDRGQMNGEKVEIHPKKKQYKVLSPVSSPEPRQVSVLIFNKSKAP